MNEEIMVLSFTRTGTELNRRLCGMLRQHGKNCARHAWISAKKGKKH